MEIKYLSEFAALAKTKNYLEAADTLYISQSSLSKHIQSVERELGVTLFDRSTRHVKLSSDGELLLHYADQITLLMNDYHRAAAAVSNKKRDTVSIASTSQMVYYGITDALAHYKGQNLNCTLNVIVESHSNLKKLLYDRVADFVWIGETADEFKDSDFSRLLYQIDSLAAALPSNHPLGKFPVLPVEKLRSETIIIQDNSSVEQKLFISLCQKHLFTPRLTSLPISAVMDFVRQGLGIAIMFKSVAQRIQASGICLTDIDSSPVINVNLMYLKNRALTPAAKHFLEFFENWPQKYLFLFFKATDFTPGLSAKPGV